MRVVTTPPSPLTAVLTGVVGCGAAWLGIEVVGQAFSDCDIGINAAANSYSLLYLLLPVLAAVNCVVFALVFRFSYAGAVRFGPAPVAGGFAFLVAVVALVLVFWGVLAVVFSDVPDWMCRETAPRWWPSWLPV